MNPTPISWTDYSSNPLKYRDPDGNVVHACVHKSGGCSKCYAEALAGRWGRKGLPFTAENMKRLTPFMDEKEIRAILTCKAASGKRCFPFDMTDLAGEWVPAALIDQAFAFMALRPDIEFQILTKRIERLLEYVRSPGVASDVANVAKAQFAAAFKPSHPLPTGIRVYPMGPIVDGQPEFGHRWFTPWPLPNVLIGVSVEDQSTANERIPVLLQVPAAKRFVSYEPALGPVDFSRFFGPQRFFPAQGPEHPHGQVELGLDRNGWIIIGGESGHNARPFDIAWARSTVKQCKDANVRCFVKQMGSNPYEQAVGTGALRLQDDRYYWNLKSSHGTDMAEWPESLRVQEFPA